MNFAFTDFDSGVKFAADRKGRTWSDSEGMFACVNRALDDGVPLTDGAYLAEIDRAELSRVFSGNIEIPMLDERVQILNAAGQTLAERYDGSAHRFVVDCAHTLYATALLTDAINRIRPPSLALVVPQVDFRLWKSYHATFWPHHLTRTIMY